jgi:hypothetical protein
MNFVFVRDAQVSCATYVPTALSIFRPSYLRRAHSFCSRQSLLAYNVVRCSCTLSFPLTARCSSCNVRHSLPQFEKRRSMWHKKKSHI